MYNIDSTFFVGQITIPNTNEIGGIDIDLIIEQGCYLFLSNLLGNKLFKELQSNLDSELNLKDDAEQKWKDLFFGCDVNGKYYEGLIQNGLNLNQSVLADYSFINWLESSSSQQTGIGNVVLQGKGAVNVNNSTTYNSIWNSIALKVGIKERLHRHKDVSYIHGVRFTDYLRSDFSDTATISDLLLSRPEDYPNPLLLAPKGDIWGIKNYIGI